MMFMTRKIVFLVLFLLAHGMVKSENPAYQFFTGNGKKVEYKTVVKNLINKDIVFFGELHNDPITHWLQLKLTKRFYSVYSDSLMLGAEMFEADDQVVLNEYLNGLISLEHFKNSTRIWPNYSTDYHPLVEFAKEKTLPFIATNIPRRYASIVAKHGFKGLDRLSEAAKEWMAPLPVEYNPELPGYKRMLKMGHMHGKSDKDIKNLPKAQAIKDATMAHFILKNYEKGKRFIHFNGTYHSNNKEGIVWYINQKHPRLKIGTIATVKQSGLRNLSENNKGKADYILVVPSDMTRTH
jgi:uncharacterized iron-regulated protein